MPCTLDLLQKYQICTSLRSSLYFLVLYSRPLFHCLDKDKTTIFLLSMLTKVRAYLHGMYGCVFYLSLVINTNKWMRLLISAWQFSIKVICSSEYTSKVWLIKQRCWMIVEQHKYISSASPGLFWRDLF